MPYQIGGRNVPTIHQHHDRAQTDDQFGHKGLPQLIVYGGKTRYLYNNNNKLIIIIFIVLLDIVIGIVNTVCCIWVLQPVSLFRGCVAGLRTIFYSGGYK